MAGVGEVVGAPCPKPRLKAFRRLLDIPGAYPICLDSNDPATVRNGFNARLLREVPEPDDEWLAGLAEFVDRILEKYLPHVMIPEFLEWLASTGYNDARKQELIDAHNALRGGMPSRKQCRKVKAFVKREFYMSYKNARMINSRCDSFKVFSGPAFKAIENAVYSCDFGLPFSPFVKHSRPIERMQLVRQLASSQGSFYATDYTAYESHFTRRVMEACEIRLYRHCLANYPEIRDRICDTLTGVNLMSTRTGLRAKVTARRMSGEMCTSLGNGFSNLMCAMYIAHRKGGSLHGLVEGDDGLFCSTVPLTREDFGRLGFTIKIDQVPRPTEASFCGMIFAESGQIIRDPWKFMVSLAWTHSSIHAGERVALGLLKAKSMSALAETPSCPIVSALAAHAYAVSRHSEAIFVEDGYHVKPCGIPVEQPISDDTRAVFQSIYGISVDQQLRAEAACRCGNLIDLARILGVHGPAFVDIAEARVSEDMAHYGARYIEQLP